MQLSPDSIIFIAGAPGSGKSNLIRYLMSLMYKHFNYGMVICRSALDGGYSWVPPECVHPIYSEELITKLQTLQNNSNTTHAYLILDDPLGEINFNSPLWNQILTTNRHLRLTIFISTQYSAKISTLARECATYAFIFKPSSEQAFKSLHEAFGQENFPRWRMFRDWLITHTSQPHSCVMYNRELSGDAKYGLLITPNMDKSTFRIVNKKKRSSKRQSESNLI